MKIISRSIVFVMLSSLAITISAAGPAPIAPLKMKMASIKAKANLVVSTAGWSGEFCTSICPQIKQDLKINKSKCKLFVQVANMGNKSTGAFAVQVKYTHWKGSATLQKVKWIGSGLAAKNKGSWHKNLYFDLGYYRSDKPVTVIVDYSSKVPESNESDNSKSILLP